MGLIPPSPLPRGSLTKSVLPQVYSFGVTLWQILERKRPFEGMEPYQVDHSSLCPPLGGGARSAYNGSAAWRSGLGQDTPGRYLASAGIPVTCHI